MHAYEHTKHTLLTEQPTAVFRRGTKAEKKSFVNIIQSRRIIHLQTQIILLLLLSLCCKEATVLSPVYNKNSHEF